MAESNGNTVEPLPELKAAFPFPIITERSDRTYPFQPNFHSLPLSGAVLQNSLPMPAAILKIHLDDKDVEQAYAEHRSQHEGDEIPPAEEPREDYDGIQNLISAEELNQNLGAIRFCPPQTKTTKYHRRLLPAVSGSASRFREAVVTLPFDGPKQGDQAEPMTEEHMRQQEEQREQNTTDAHYLRAQTTISHNVLGCDGVRNGHPQALTCCAAQGYAPFGQSTDNFNECLTNDHFVSYVSPFDLTQRTKDGRPMMFTASLQTNNREAMQKFKGEVSVLQTRKVYNDLDQPAFTDLTFAVIQASGSLHITLHEKWRKELFPKEQTAASDPAKTGSGKEENGEKGTEEEISNESLKTDRGEKEDTTDDDFALRFGEKLRIDKESSKPSFLRRCAEAEGKFDRVLGPPLPNPSQAMSFALILQKGEQPFLVEIRKRLLENELWSRPVFHPEFLYFNSRFSVREHYQAQPLPLGVPQSESVSEYYEDAHLTWTYRDPVSYYKTRREKWDKLPSDKVAELHKLAQAVVREADMEEESEVTTIADTYTLCQNWLREAKSKGIVIPPGERRPSRIKKFGQRAKSSPNQPIHFEASVTLKKDYFENRREQYFQDLKKSMSEDFLCEDQTAAKPPSPNNWPAFFNSRPSFQHVRAFPSEFKGPDAMDANGKPCKEAMELSLQQFKSTRVADMSRFREDVLMDNCQPKANVQGDQGSSTLPRNKFLGGQFGDSIVFGVGGRVGEKASLFSNVESCAKRPIQSSRNCLELRKEYPATTLCPDCARWSNPDPRKDLGMIHNKQTAPTEPTPILPEDQAVKLACLGDMKDIRDFIMDLSASLQGSSNDFVSLTIAFSNGDSK